jgi:ABC-type Fe3+/spermidine/putrescine transport system ATPase subunit
MLEVEKIVKTYEGKPLLREVSFKVQRDETICLLGASGSGKSTLLLTIAGLEVPDAGRILWDGQDLAPIPAHMRDFGLVFQDYALFPHLDVFDNIAYGLKMKHWGAEETRKRVLEVLQLVNLEDFEHRKVTDLSGGEQQRVALARALAPRPRLLMFDEPLGALDRALRESLVLQLRQILQETHLPAIYVTHDQDEASAIADRVLLLHEGEIVRDGSVSEVWAHPGSVWAAEFLGVGTILEGQMMDGQGHLDTPYGSLHIPCSDGHRADDQVKLLARPSQDEKGSAIEGRVADVVFQRDRFRVTLEGGLFVYMDAAPKVGQDIKVNVHVECLE